MSENMMSQISGEYCNLTASEKKVADFVTSHQRQAQYMSISELAEASKVAEATISRFSRRMGCKSFNAFKLSLAKADTILGSSTELVTDEIQDSDSFADISHKLCTADMDAISQTMQLIDEKNVAAAADLLNNAGKVLCMGQGGSMLIAQQAAHMFSTVSGKFWAISDNHNQAMAVVNADPTDVILFFSYSGATRELVSTITLARDRGLSCILVTHFPKSPGALMADIVLRCGANETPMQAGSIAAKIAQLYLLDVLFTEFCRRDMGRCKENRSRVAAALSGKHFG